ncbi:hypothetical protein [Alkalicoccus luteus]|uniref:STAS domain-containing protein n=1 Tax=Alkalicoccus luteus TaxID=1237094 RepID=A0A969PQW4_9BACI|nr:hypothetical protein [Alkalicoccus luteus]NJP38727.1 hypothetical protein [Alkalicoccus luteus]
MSENITNNGTTIHIQLPARLTAEEAAVMRRNLLEYGSRHARHFRFQGAEGFIIDTLFLGILATLIRRCRATISISGLSSEAVSACRKARMDRVLQLI